MIRCLLLVTGLAYGGAETQVMHIAIRLRRRGWTVQLVSLMPPRAYVEELGAAGIPVFSLGIRRKVPDPRPVLRLARFIREWRPHIVHSQMVHANLAARFSRLIAPMPVLICTAHNIDERGRKGSGRLREITYRLTDPLSDLTTQICWAGLERYVRVGAVPHHKIRYVPNGVDTARFKPDLEARLGLRKELNVEGSFVWLAVGRLDLQKDYSNLLRAFAKVRGAKPEALLLIAGDGPLRPALEGLARTLGVDERIHFLGIRRDVPELMNAADAYVMSSAWEGMPMVLLEASATGLPIVATDTGGNREIVLDGKSGFLVPPKDSEALAQAMIRMMALSPDERRTLGQAGREYVVRSYDIERVVDLWEDLYMEFLNKKGVEV